jgi:hypothetical protein
VSIAGVTSWGWKILLVFGKWFKDIAPFAWLPALIVSGISAYYAHENFKLQTAAARPELAYPRISVRNPYGEALLDLALRNVGNRSATKMKIIVRTVDIESGRTETLTEIVGSN